MELVNSVKIFLSQMTLIRWFTLLLGSLTLTLTILLFWIYYFLLMLVFVLQWPSIGKFRSWCCLKFSLIFKMRCPILWHSLWLFLHWFAESLWPFERCSIGWYLQTQGFCCCSQTLWVRSGWNWCLYPSW